MTTIINISAYRFTHLSSSIILSLQAKLKKACQCLNLKGTVLLSEEGINLFLAGSERAIIQFKLFLDSYEYFKNLRFLETTSDFQPFKKLLVKVKKEIISFGVATVQPEKSTAAMITPEALKQALDHGRDLLLLDTRNTFEYELGSFDNATHLGLTRFREFPSVVKKLTNNRVTSTIVTFCTGGIRCEKASAYLLQSGFKQVYQLQGGIINYFRQCGKKHYHGDCFVFDHRKVVTVADTIASIS